MGYVVFHSVKIKSSGDVLMFFMFYNFSCSSSVIEEANWLTLSDDIQKPGAGFDAVICLGNSFAHLPDFKGMLETKGQIHFFHFFPIFILFLNFVSKITNFSLDSESQ